MESNETPISTHVTVTSTQSNGTSISSPNIESNQTPRDVILSQYRHMMHISSFGGVNMMWSPGGIALSFDDKGDGLAKTIERLVDGDGRGSLAFAAAGGRVDVCRYLLEELSITINVKDQHDATPLSYGAIRGHLETVRYLLEQGADVDGGLGSLVKYFSAKPPLHYALLGGNAMILELLLNNGATISASALPYAALLGQVDAVRVLLANNADPDGLADATSPLVATIISNSVDIINMLLKAKARKNEQSRGLFPLTFAAHYGRTELVTSLFRAKANTSVTDKNNMTALEIAAAAGNREMVEVLLPKTVRILKYPEWTVDGLIEHFRSVAASGAGMFEKEPFESLFLERMDYVEDNHRRKPFLAALWQAEFEAYFRCMVNAAKGSVKARLLSAKLIPRYIQYFPSLKREAAAFQLSLCKDGVFKVRLLAIRGLPLLCGDTPECAKEIAHVLAKIPTDQHVDRNEYLEHDAMQRALTSLLRLGSNKKSCDESWTRGFFTKAFAKHIQQHKEMGDDSLRDTVLRIIRNEAFPLKNQAWPQRQETGSILLEFLKEVLKRLSGVKEMKGFLDKFAEPPDDDFFFMDMKDSRGFRKVKLDFANEWNLPWKSYETIFPLAQPPLLNYDYFICCDGAHSRSRAGWAVVIRNRFLKIIKVLCQESETKVTSQHSEWEAIVAGLEASVGLVANTILFTSDYKSAIKQLASMADMYNADESVPIRRDEGRPAELKPIEDESAMPKKKTKKEKKEERIEKRRKCKQDDVDFRVKNIMLAAAKFVREHLEPEIMFFEHTKREGLAVVDYFTRRGTTSRLSVIEPITDNEEFSYDHVTDYLEEKARLGLPNFRPSNDRKRMIALILIAFTMLAKVFQFNPRA